MLSFLVPWLPLATKLVLTAMIVVGASVATERAGPLVGALLVTLPVTTWPAFVFLSLDHDTAFLSASALTSLGMNVVNGVLFIVYATLAQRRGLVISLAAALAAWLGLAWFARDLSWTLALAALGNIVAYPVYLWLARPLRHAAMPRLARQWYELPLRTLMVCALMGTVLMISHWAGPRLTGIVAIFPVSTVSTILVLHSRVGGRPSAAVIANGLWGLIGVSFSMAVLHLTVVPLGAAIALTLTLATAIGWNLSVWVARRRYAMPARGAVSR